ncbi:AraC family transcriptional regulator ligand-binding domain-containing protein [Nocardioides sp. SYSU DS0663]|uniref:AraC family transcriptional regulator n=1 Tax=Nocardioides sp. SYSU DS0663 TaxID=3416445 RepID=UPI003F4BB001
MVRHLPPERAPDDWEYPRAVAGVALLVRYAVARGVPARVVLAGTGLREADLAVADREVTAAQELRVVRTLQRLLPGSGADVGATYRASTFGVLGYALLASRTVGDALDVTLRFIDLSFAFALPRAEVADGRVRLVVDGGALPADVRAFLVARDATAIDVVAAALVPGGLGSTLTVAEDHAVLEVPAAELQRPLPRDPRATSMAHAMLRDVVARRRERTGVARDVQVLITQQLPDGAPMGAVAASLGLSERSLRRRLAGEGVGYRALVDEVRESLARSLLESRATLPVADVATRLGYADAAAFTHAFTRWTGVPPAAYAQGSR